MHSYLFPLLDVLYVTQHAKTRLFSKIKFFEKNPPSDSALCSVHFKTNCMKIGRVFPKIQLLKQKSPTQFSGIVLLRKLSLKVTIKNKINCKLVQEITKFVKFIYKKNSFIEHKKWNRMEPNPITHGDMGWSWA